MQTSDVDQVIILNPDTDVMALDSIYLIHLKKGCRPGSLQPFLWAKKAVPRTAKNNIILLTYFFLKLIL